MGLFDKIETAKPSMDANYIRDGDYVVRINRVKSGDTRTNGPFVAVEMVVAHVYDDGEGKGHKVGEECCHMMLTKHDSFEGNFKAMVMAIMGCDADEVTKEESEEIVSEANPMGGMFVRLVNRTIMTKAKKPFTKANYKHAIPVEDLPEILTEEEFTRFVK